MDEEGHSPFWPTSQQCLIVGNLILQHFEGRYYAGKVIGLWPSALVVGGFYYHVLYEDGREENLEEDQMLRGKATYDH